MRLSMRPSVLLKQIGAIETTEQYLWNPRVEHAFGKPHRNALWSKSHRNEWSKHLSILHSTVCTDVPTNECVSKGFALNEKNGWIAIMSKTQITVLTPIGSCSFQQIASYTFNTEQTLNNSDKFKARIRFVNKDIFVWSHSKANVQHYKIDSKNQIILVDTLVDGTYFRDSDTVDITVNDDYLILLFKEWLGVYKLYPSLKWYHAVAYSKTSDIVPHGLEMCHYDYRQNNNSEVIDNSCKSYAIVNVDGHLITTHVTNPTYAYLHVASKVGKKSSFCVSKKYGVFYTNNDGTVLYQSPHLEAKSVQKILEIMPNHCKIYSIKTGGMGGGVCAQNISKICNIVYDESYGISGRLLLFCLNYSNENSNKYCIHQMVSYNDFIHFIDNNDNCETNETDFYANPMIVYLYQMLYGDDIMQKLLCHKMESNEYKQNLDLKRKCAMDSFVKKEEFEFVEWMRESVKLPQYCEVLIANGFDSLLICTHLNMEHLKALGITKLGHQIQIMKEIEKLNVDSNANNTNTNHKKRKREGMNGNENEQNMENEHNDRKRARLNDNTRSAK